MTPRGLGFGLLLWAAAQAGARPAAESFGFEVYWGGMVVGRARIAVLPTTDSNQFVVRTTAKANNAIQSIYPVRDTVESWIRVSDGQPLRFHKRLNEGSYSASVRLDFDRREKVVRVKGGHRKGQAPDTVVAIPDQVHDLLSAFHAVRSAELVPGKSITLAIVDNRKLFKQVEVACVGRETVELDHGTFQTLVIEPRLHGDALFKSKGKLKIWLTDDTRRMPVQMMSEIKLGTIRAELVDHAP